MLAALGFACPGCGWVTESARPGSSLRAFSGVYLACEHRYFPCESMIADVPVNSSCLAPPWGFSPRLNFLQEFSAWLGGTEITYPGVGVYHVPIVHGLRPRPPPVKGLTLGITGISLRWAGCLFQRWGVSLPSLRSTMWLKEWFSTVCRLSIILMGRRVRGVEDFDSSFSKAS